MKIEIITCLNCQKEAVKQARELKRQRKRGRTKFFCTQSCATSYSNKFTPRFDVHHNHSPLSGIQLDKYSSFRYFMRRIKDRDSNHLSSKRIGWFQTDFDEKYLKYIWEEQNGKCPLTGWELILPYGTAGWDDDIICLNRASIDRIDSSIGYIKGNVRFISFIANMAKNCFSDNQVIYFCQSVVDNLKSK